MKKRNFEHDPAEMFISSAQEETAQEEAQQKKTVYVSTYEVPAGYTLQRERKTERMQLLVRPTTKKNIVKLAKSKGMSANEYINIVLEECIEKNGDL